MTMIERVGAALWDKINTATEPSGKCVFTGEDLARAAIEAMREPTEGMVEAYSQACERVGFRLYITAKDALGPMITAALSEGEG